MSMQGGGIALSSRDRVSFSKTLLGSFTPGSGAVPFEQSIAF